MTILSVLAAISFSLLLGCQSSNESDFSSKKQRSAKPVKSKSTDATEIFGREVDGDPESLAAEIYDIPRGTRTVEILRDMDPIKILSADNINVPEQDFSAGFPSMPDLQEWFGVRYRGTLIIEESGRHNFKMLADDGAKLFISNQLIIDADGIHPAVKKKGSIYLDTGHYDIEVLYFQGPKYQLGLQLFWMPPGASRMSIIPASAFEELR